jgi:hypothetical protein
MAQKENPPGVPGRPPQNQPNQQQQPPMRGILAWAAIFILMLVMFRFWTLHQETYKEIPYNPDFVQFVETGRIKDCEIIRDASGLEYIRGEALPAADAGKDIKPFKFKVYIIKADEPLEKFLRANKVGFLPALPGSSLSSDGLLAKAHGFVRQIGCWK